MKNKQNDKSRPDSAVSPICSLPADSLRETFYPSHPLSLWLLLFYSPGSEHAQGTRTLGCQPPSLCCPHRPRPAAWPASGTPVPARRSLRSGRDRTLVPHAWGAPHGGLRVAGETVSPATSGLGEWIFFHFEAPELGSVTFFSLLCNTFYPSAGFTDKKPKRHKNTLNSYFSIF